MTIALNLLVLLVLPWLLLGVVTRTKALWSGRKGPPLFQPLFDVIRLLRKRSVYSATTTAVFRVTPWIGLVTTLAAAAMVPVAGVAPLVSFPFDFVLLAYLWGLGRVALMLGALDTGSSFEGMGASREATYATLVEPAWFLVMGALVALGSEPSIGGALAARLSGPAAAVVIGAAAAALRVVVQAESARVPVDDPTTHLELTMIHEVMVLDHGGPELAAIQTAAAVKLTVGVALVSALLNPFYGGDRPALAAVTALGLALALGALVGTIESLMARLQLRIVPRYLFVGVAAGAVALLATTWQGAAP